MEKKTKQKDDWQPTTNRFVAFFDIMGFKDLVLNKEHEEIVEILNSLSKSRIELEGANNTPLPLGNSSWGESKSFTFSDSIIFFTKSDTIADLNKIMLDCRYMIKKSLDYQVPIKGAISYGKITIDKDTSVYFGQPIIDAFLLHEDLHLFSVIADSKFEIKIKQLKSKVLESSFEWYKTPLKSGKSYHHILKPTTKTKEEALTNLNKLYDTVSGKPRQYIDNTIEFLNTAKFK